MADCGDGAFEFIETHFYDCVYTWSQCLGFALGLTSICLWITAQMPQFLDNMRNQSAAALSVYFLVQWFLGDTLNLLGCLLNGQQLPTTTYLAMYFLLSDVVMLTQFLYYGALNKRKEALARRAAAHRAARKKAGSGGGGGSGAVSRTPSTTRGARVLHYEETPGQTQHPHAHHRHHTHSAAHHQLHAQQVLSTQAGADRAAHWPPEQLPAILHTAAMSAGEPPAHMRSDSVAIPIDWDASRQEHSIASTCCDTSRTQQQDSLASGSIDAANGNSTHLGSQHAVLRGKAAGLSGAQAAAAAGDQGPAGGGGAGCAGEGGMIEEGEEGHRLVVGGSEGRVHGSVGSSGLVAVVGAVSLLSLVALGISVTWSPRAPPDPRPLLMPHLQRYNAPEQHHRHWEAAGSGRQQGSAVSSGITTGSSSSSSHVWLSRLVGSSSTGDDEPGDDDSGGSSSSSGSSGCWWPCWWGPDFDWPHLLGSVFGYCSMCLYLTSRFSQIYKNWCRRSTEGLSKVMFVCTMSANLCTGFSILLRLQSASSLKEQLPWIGGAFGTVWLDAIIFWQATTYTSLAGKAATPTPAAPDSSLMSSPARMRRGTSARASPERDLL